MDSQTKENPILLSTAPNAFLNNLRALYNHGKYTDLLITCKGREWNVHKLCVCSHSPFFHSTCSGGFKEAKENAVDLSDDDPQVVETLIHYFYNFDYPDPTNGQNDVPPIVLDVQMYIIADKYFIEPLKQLAIQKFENRAKLEWDTDAFADAVGEAYDSTAEGSNPLKRIAISTVKKHSKELLDESKGYTHFLKILSTTPAFGADTAIALAWGHDENKYKCPSCYKTFVCIMGLSTVYWCPLGCGPWSGETWSTYLA